MLNEKSKKIECILCQSYARDKLGDAGMQDVKISVRHFYKQATPCSIFCGIILVPVIGALIFIEILIRRIGSITVAAKRSETYEQ